MPTSALPRGKTTTLLLKSESAFGNPPSGDWTQTFAYSHTSDFRKPFEDDPLLGLPRQNDRDRTAPAPGLITFDDSIVVPLDFNHFGVWLHALFGTAVVTGVADPFTHVFSSGLEALPWRSHEWKLAGNMFEQDVGLVSSRLSIDMSRAAGSSARPSSSWGRRRTRWPPVGAARRRRHGRVRNAPPPSACSSSTAWRPPTS
jgi:hypothetical protein